MIEAIRQEIPHGLIAFWAVGVLVIGPLAVALALWITNSI
jgi:hypothetical protein